MTEQQSQQLKETVLKAIESGQVKMRPKWQFVLRAALLVAGIVLVALTALFLFSFIVFTLRQTGVLFVPGFGPQGFGVFFNSLPWILFIVSAVFIILLEILIRKYSFAYGRPFMYSVLGIIIIVVAGGTVLGYTSFHQDLFDRAERGGLPFGRPLYEHFTQPPDDVTVGTITELDNPGYKIQDPKNEVYVVNVTTQTQLPPGSNFAVGNNVVVLGHRNGNIIEAEGIEKPGSLPPPPPRDDNHPPQVQPAE